MNIGFFMFSIIALMLLSCACYLMALAEEEKNKRTAGCLTGTIILCFAILLLLASSVIYKETNDNTVEVVGYSQTLEVNGS